MVYETNIPDVVITEDLANPHFRPMPVEETPSLVTFVLSQDYALVNALSDHIAREHTELLRRDCLIDLERFARTTDRGLPAVPPNIDTYQSLGNGLFALPAGDALLQFQCRRVLGRPRPMEQCYTGLAIDVVPEDGRKYAAARNRSEPFDVLFLEPRSHLLTHVGVEVPCVHESLSPVFQTVDGRWARISRQKIVLRSEPEILSTAMAHLEAEPLGALDLRDAGTLDPALQAAWNARVQLGRYLTDVTVALSPLVSQTGWIPHHYSSVRAALLQELGIQTPLGRSILDWALYLAHLAAAGFAFILLCYYVGGWIHCCCGSCLDAARTRVHMQWNDMWNRYEPPPEQNQANLPLHPRGSQGPAPQVLPLRTRSRTGSPDPPPAEAAHWSQNWSGRRHLLEPNQQDALGDNEWQNKRVEFIRPSALVRDDPPIGVPSFRATRPPLRRQLANLASDTEDSVSQRQLANLASDTEDSVSQRQLANLASDTEDSVSQLQPPPPPPPPPVLPPPSSPPNASLAPSRLGSRPPSSLRDSLVDHLRASPLLTTSHSDPDQSPSHDDSDDDDNSFADRRRRVERALARSGLPIPPRS